VTGESSGEAAPDQSLEAAESAYQAQVRRDLQRNYIAHLSHGLLGQTGFRLLNAPTFLPAYLFMLTGGELAVGIARSAQAFGMFLSPIFGATMIEHRRRVLPVGFVVGACMRLMVLGIAMAGFLLSDVWVVRVVCLLLVGFGFFMGMQGVIFSFLMSKVIPVGRRGFLLGFRNFLGGLTASGVAYLGGRYLIEPNVFGNGYATTFLLAFVLTSLGLMMLLGVREPEPPQVREAKGVGDRLRELPALLRSDRGFTLYFLARALSTMGRMAVPFYFVYADMALDGSTAENLAILTPCFLLANSTINLPWGFLADRTGFRLVFLASIAIWIASALLMMLTSGIVGFAIAFFGVGAGLGGFMMSAQNMVLEFGKREDLPLRIAVAN
jgi:MFS family permease